MQNMQFYLSACRCWLRSTNDARLDGEDVLGKPKIAAIQIVPNMQSDLWLCRCWLRSTNNTRSDGDNFLGKQKDKR